MVLVVGASGSTGKLVVEELLRKGYRVKAMLRSPEKLPLVIRNHPSINLIVASVLELSDEELASASNECLAVISCLGHNLNFKGIYGHPRRLVTESTRRLCQSIIQNRPTSPVKFILMNTAGNRNRDLHEPLSLAEKGILVLLRMFLPPHADNENAADFLRLQIGPHNPTIEWVAVRPDTLINEDETSRYEIYLSPVRSAIFNPGKTSRINIAHFMTELVMKSDIWEKWKGKMPVIYNVS